MALYRLFPGCKLRRARPDRALLTTEPPRRGKGSGCPLPLFPEADIFTLFCDPETLSPELRTRRITTSFLNPFRRCYRNLLPLKPMALQCFDLRDYDLVISNESGPAKGVIFPSSARHFCYYHTPMRHLWDLYPAYRNESVSSSPKRLLMAP